MGLVIKFPFVRSNNYLRAYRLLPSTKAALSILESMEFAASAAPAVFVGNASISFTATGDFTAGSPIGDANFVGNASFSFASAGSFRANASLGGSTTLTFTQTGALRAGSSLTGAATVAFNTAGTLNARASFQGSTSFAFATGGDFTAGTGGAAANFVGNAGFSFSAAGDFVAASSEQTISNEQLGGGFKRVYLVQRKRKEAEKALGYAEKRAEQAAKAIEAQAQETAQAVETAAKQAKLAAARKSIERAKARLANIEREAVAALGESQAAKGIVQNEVLKAEEAVLAARFERDAAELAYQQWLAEEEVVISMLLAA